MGTIRIILPEIEREGAVALMNLIYVENPLFGRDWSDIGVFKPNCTL